ncbi:MAG TPA: (E)-4-hydroxy-3-methylbut-2-enyl-diphosphate synthase [Prolixibacteraceae bacterium]|mgnify:CR=1 FL=1|nr:(E)-4-hydroxy-3-methylbut-2-enyl-diphosphate synthase [Prolixibacteraceae bacterium]HPS12077.1 (E)-4-hydroxy-3-methylbut-2-enyl-diphosphate synthase [Prolixibacteraceae bacterium]
MMDRNFNYCKTLTEYRRENTLEVNIGGVPLGGLNLIRLQSMTDTDTLDTDATVDQIVRIVRAGADYVRIAVKSTKDAENLKNISDKIREMGFNTPLIADVHFNPKIAEVAARYVSKVRINPGNFYDKRAQFQNFLYTDEEYREELEKLEETLTPFLNVCKEYDTAIRIGANQGSLSDRIMSRYGDTPAGIVESVMEFLRICKKNDFHKIVISIKSWNTRMLVYTVRLMNYKMRLEDMNYPFHIGVTEAGEGEDGRIRSAVGIGTLLIDGIGDTIRVSLTEKPENEIPFAKKLVDVVTRRRGHARIEAPVFAQTNPFEFERRYGRPVRKIGNRRPPVVIASLNGNEILEVSNLNGKLEPDYYYDERHIINRLGKKFPILSLEDYLYNDIYQSSHRFIRMTRTEFVEFRKENPEIVQKLKVERKAVILLESENANRYADMRAFFMLMESIVCRLSVVLCGNYNERNLLDLQLKAATDFGGLFIDGYGDGILLTNDNDYIFYSDLKNTSFAILQATRMRITKSEFISCPGCGRTQFDLHKTTLEIKNHFSHLKHLKIGIMGCVVNGPGEMGDADYGFVGSGNGKVNLYKGQKVVKRHIPYEEAVSELEKIIRENNDWIEM